MGAQGHQKSGKPMLPAPCKDKPNHSNCNSFDEASRKSLYAAFRALGNIDDQRKFINKHIQNKVKARNTRHLTESRRNYTVSYHFTVKGEMAKVCREFFLSTLNITDSLIRSTISKTNDQGCVGMDKRGKHAPHNKLPESQATFLKKHITSFPAVESHYCRKSTGRRYLDPCLNVQIMYKLYVEECTKQNLAPVSISKYRQVFRKYNLGFFKPKKDQCKYCTAYKSLNMDEKEERKENYQRHISKKELARQERDLDKEVSKLNSSTIAFNFDLQAVLTTPKGPSGQIYYMRKFAVYNFTVYNLASQKVLCYLWDETQGKRGANEISTCIYDYIISSYNNAECIRMMSDGCGGQQKNSIFATMCLNLVQTHPTLQTIDHKFFETGHTEMECDSIHSKIEKKSKFVPVYTPEGWAQIIRSARSNPFPFEVKTMMFDDFLDFKLAATVTNLNIPWRKVCWLQYRKNAPDTLFYKTNFEEDFIIRKISNKRKRTDGQLQKAYIKCLAISSAKKRI